MYINRPTIAIKIPNDKYLELIPNPDCFKIYIKRNNKITKKTVYDSRVDEYEVSLLKRYEDTDTLFVKVLKYNGHYPLHTFRIHLDFEHHNKKWSLLNNGIERKHVYKCVLDKKDSYQLVLCLECDYDGCASKKVKKAFKYGYTIHIDNYNDLLEAEKWCKKRNVPLHYFYRDEVVTREYVASFVSQ